MQNCPFRKIFYTVGESRNNGRTYYSAENSNEAHSFAFQFSAAVFAVQCNIVKNSTMLCRAGQLTVLQWSLVKCSAMQCSEGIALHF